MAPPLWSATPPIRLTRSATADRLADAHFTVFDGNLYFEAETGKGDELVEIDSTGASHVIDVNPTVGPPTGDGFPGANGGFGVYTPIQTVFGTDGNDHLGGGANTIFIGGKGNDTITGAGAGSHDTAVIDSNFANANIGLNNGVVTVTTANGTDTLTGIDRIQFADKGLLIVDPTGEYGFKSVQAAVNAATEGDTIFVLPGTYTDSTINPFSSVPGGLFINTPNLTLQGVDATGTAFTSVSDANKALLPTIIPGSETDFGSNIFIGPNADNTTLTGLHLQAGPDTTNKLLEIWSNNATITNDFIDVNANPATYALATGPNANGLFDPITGYTGAIAIYFNDNGTPFTDEIASFNVSHNILNEGVDISNGVGIPGSIAAERDHLEQYLRGNLLDLDRPRPLRHGRAQRQRSGHRLPVRAEPVPDCHRQSFRRQHHAVPDARQRRHRRRPADLGEVAASSRPTATVNTTYAYVEKPNRRPRARHARPRRRPVLQLRGHQYASTRSSSRSRAPAATTCSPARRPTSIRATRSSSRAGRTPSPPRSTSTTCRSSRMPIRRT